MKRMKQRLSLLLALLMTMTLLVGCGRKAEEEEKFILRVSVCDEITSLDPAMNTDTEAQSVYYTLYENLMRYVDDGTGSAALKNGMAKEYTETNNYDGSVTYEFSLRSSARWSDGKKVRADDFVYAWRRLVDPATQSPNHETLSMVRGYDEVRRSGNTAALAVSAKDDQTFSVTLDAPCAYFIDGVCTSVATMPLRQDAVEKEVEDWATSFTIPTNGAYRVGAWTKRSMLQTKRNDKYYESKLVGPDAVRFVFAADAESAYRLYESGEVDYVSKLPQEVLSQETVREQLTTTPLFATYCVLYNNMTDTFSDVHARRALDLAIDRTEISESMGAEFSPAGGLVPSGVRDSGEREDEDDYRTVGGTLCAIDEESYAERCTDARSELVSAGYEGGMDFPTVEYLYSEDDEVGAVVAAALQDMWSDVLGITVQPRSLPEKEYHDRIAAGEYELAGQYVSARQNDAMSFLDCFAGGHSDNLVFYSDPTYDILMGVAGKSENVSARIAFLHDAESMLLESTALSPVAFGVSTHILREGLQGIYYDGLGNSYLTNVTQVETT